MKFVLVGTAALVLIAGCSGGGGMAARSRATTAPARETAGQIQKSPATMPSNASETLHALQQHFVDELTIVRPSVVQISTQEALGSGVVYDGRGDIVTNAHVVGTASTFQVTWFDGTTTSATLVGKDLRNDLAVIKVAKGNGAARVATFGDSDGLQTGDIALAIGNPLGLDSTVTEGIVSASQRTVAESSSTVLHVIQTSAAINPGNSGGALVDVDGRLIGIPTLAATDPEFGGSPAEGVGFAIPSNTARTVADRLIAAH